ncbi:MAG: hypothetical protein LLF94_03035 [Chlamydiales bacterium]|nr:hypothetical protein [Chlamydiales bacterium]
MQRLGPDYSPALLTGFYSQGTQDNRANVTAAAQPILRGSSREIPLPLNTLTVQHEDEYSRLADKLKSMLPENALIIPAEIVNNVHSKLSASEKKNFLLALACLAKSYADCTVTHTAKGAVAIGKSGTAYLAYNIEFKIYLPNAYIQPLAFLVSTLRAHGEENVQAMGFSHELSGSELDLFKAIAWAPDCKVVVRGLPDPLKVIVLPKGEVDKRLKFPAGSRISNLRSDDSLKEFASGAAQTAAHDSFSPVTNAKLGAVIVGIDNRVYPGSYLEIPNSYTVMGPLQGAIASYLSGGNSYDKIKAIMVAVKMPKNCSSAPQEAEIELIIKKIPNEIILHIEEFF